MHFTKMQGIGNDYLYVNCFAEQPKGDLAQLARSMSDRHFGVGSDGLVLICPCEEADAEMRMFNSDGSESEMCGNASRCVGRYLYERGLVKKELIRLKTGAGIRELHLTVENDIVKGVTVDMGAPILEAAQIPVKLPNDKTMGYPVNVDGIEYRIHCVSMGNPHCVIFGDDPKAINLSELGPKFEYHPLFPRKTNTEFVQVIDPTRLNMRVWERGAGETLACGTGASAVCVAAHLAGLAQREVDIRLLGGELHIHWNEKDNHVYMTGPAEFVFDGVWPD